MFSRLAALCLVLAVFSQSTIAGPVTVSSLVFFKELGCLFHCIQSIFVTSEPTGVVFSSVEASESPFPGTGSIAPSESPIAVTSVAVGSAPSESPIAVTSVAVGSAPSGSPIAVTSVAVGSESPVGSITSVAVASSSAVGVASSFFSEPSASTASGSDACPSFGAPTVTITVTAFPSGASSSFVGVASGSAEAVTITASA
ncbi:hypothetical protein BC629DRAFT_1524707 [Irpex lacteus]|nr:hypothetical protein BC629DRAFT_1524707 [Irpex lacteus]